MGYACPVCETPQMDAEHLANHLAFTALLGDDDHEDWLDEHAPGWAEEDEATLGERVTEYAEEREYPQVFEDTTEDHQHDHGERSGALFDDEHAHTPEGERGPATRASDAETEEVLEEARELTRRMLEDESEGEESAEDGNG